MSTSIKIYLLALLFPLAAAPAVFAAEAGGKPEKADVIVTYAQPSGAFTPIWVAHDTGLFKKYGLNSRLQLLTPQVSAQAVISEEADFYTDEIFDLRSADNSPTSMRKNFPTPRAPMPRSSTTTRLSMRSAGRAFSRRWE